MPETIKKKGPELVFGLASVFVYKQKVLPMETYIWAQIHTDTHAHVHFHFPVDHSLSPAHTHPLTLEHLDTKS